MTVSRKTLVSVLLLIALSLASTACSSAPKTGTSGSNAPAGGSTSGVTIVEKNFAFEPATLDVKVGDTVTFKNEDSAPHNVKIDGQELGEQQPGGDVTWTASKAGSFPYNCTIHPSMTGQLTVK